MLKNELIRDSNREIIQQLKGGRDRNSLLKRLASESKLVLDPLKINLLLSSKKRVINQVTLIPKK